LEGLKVMIVKGHQGGRVFSAREGKLAGFGDSEHEAAYRLLALQARERRLAELISSHHATQKEKGESWQKWTR
jgi:hypothetical protein